MKDYTEEDLNIDIEWLVGKGLDYCEAQEFILRLLASRLVEE